MPEVGRFIKSFVCVWLIAICGAGPAQAFLGEESSKIEQHYGKPLLPASETDGESSFAYSAVGYRVVVVFKDDHSVSESFSRLQAPKALTIRTIHAFLKLHSDGKDWLEVEKSAGRQVWRRPGAMAFYLDDTDVPQLVFSTVAYVKAGLEPSPTPTPTPAASPVTLVANAKPAPTPALTLDKAVQCSATTKKGRRCTRMTTNPSGLCFQHQGG